MCMKMITINGGHNDTTVGKAYCRTWAYFGAPVFLFMIACTNPIDVPPVPHEAYKLGDLYQGDSERTAVLYAWDQLVDIEILPQCADTVMEVPIRYVEVEELACGIRGCTMSREHMPYRVDIAPLNDKHLQHTAVHELAHVLEICQAKYSYNPRTRHERSSKHEIPEIWGESDSVISLAVSVL